MNASADILNASRYGAAWPGLDHRREFLWRRQNPAAYRTVRFRQTDARLPVIRSSASSNASPLQRRPDKLHQQKRPGASIAAQDFSFDVSPRIVVAALELGDVFPFREFSHQRVFAAAVVVMFNWFDPELAGGARPGIATRIVESGFFRTSVPMTYRWHHLDLQGLRDMEEVRRRLDRANFSLKSQNALYFAMNRFGGEFSGMATFS